MCSYNTSIYVLHVLQIWRVTSPWLRWNTLIVLELEDPKIAVFRVYCHARRIERLLTKMSCDTIPSMTNKYSCIYILVLSSLSLLVSRLGQSFVQSIEEFIVKRRRVDRFRQLWCRCHFDRCQWYSRRWLRLSLFHRYRLGLY